MTNYLHSLWLFKEVTIMLERNFQPNLIKRIRSQFPGSFVLKTNPNQMQGIPDLVVLFGDRWAVLEVKRSLKASYRPNQPFYLTLLGKMGFARRISPETQEEILNEMDEYFSYRVLK